MPLCDNQNLALTCGHLPCFPGSNKEITGVMLPYLEILIPCGRFSFHDAKHQNMRLHAKTNKELQNNQSKATVRIRFPCFLEEKTCKQINQSFKPEMWTFFVGYKVLNFFIKLKMFL